MQNTKHPTPVYLSQAVRDWEQRWFAQGNSSFGLMQQAAWLMCDALLKRLDDGARIAVWCGVGNNGGDGYLLAKYLQDSDRAYRITILQTGAPMSEDCIRACAAAADSGVAMIDAAQAKSQAAWDAHIDAMFGNGLNKPLNEAACALVADFNAAQGRKIAIDMPTGLHPDTGKVMGAATVCDVSLCLVGIKMGLLMGEAKAFVGEIVPISLIPPDAQLDTAAMIDNRLPNLPARTGLGSTAHKGSFGSLLVIGGHPLMGGAALLAAEAAIRLGAGRVTVMTHHNHHSAIIARLPNLMLANIAQDINEKLIGMTAVCFGMGLGRDAWSAAVFERVFAALQQNPQLQVVLDADALWHLANQPTTLPAHWVATPHHAEAARLLGVSAEAIAQDRLGAIHALQAHYGGRWLLKGANTLTIDDGGVRICTLGNAGMATAGMGDVLSGMIAGIIAQAPTVPLSAIAALHAHAGDALAGKSVCVDVNKMAKVAARLLKNHSANNP